MSHGGIRKYNGIVLQVANRKGNTMATETTQKATVEKSWRVSIQTKYLAPTDYRGSRLKVWHGDSKALTLSWDYALDVADNHAKAVQAYLDHMEWDGMWIIGAGANGAGYVAVWAGNH